MTFLRFLKKRRVVPMLIRIEEFAFKKPFGKGILPLDINRIQLVFDRLYLSQLTPLPINPFIVLNK